MQSAFLDWPTHAVTCEERHHLSVFFGRHPQPLSGFTYASLVTWDPIFRYGLSFADPETLLISCILGAGGQRHLMQPVGCFSSPVQQRMLCAAETLPYVLKIVGVSDDFLARHAKFVERFEVVEDATASNYVYLSDDLARLAGRKYARKRNLLSQAGSLYRWDSEPLSGANTRACVEVLRSIREQENPETDVNLAQELTALDRTLCKWEELGQEGILLRVEGRPVAFSIFEPISPTTVAVHFERALRMYKGLYQVINWETAKVIVKKGFEFINREEDLGSPGLREAKRSYAPIRLMPAYELRFRKLTAGREAATPR